MTFIRDLKKLDRYKNILPRLFLLVRTYLEIGYRET